MHFSILRTVATIAFSLLITACAHTETPTTAPLRPPSAGAIASVYRFDFVLRDTEGGDLSEYPYSLVLAEHQAGEISTSENTPAESAETDLTHAQPVAEVTIRALYRESQAGLVLDVDLEISRVRPNGRVELLTARGNALAGRSQGEPLASIAHANGVYELFVTAAPLGTRTRTHGPRSCPVA